MIRSRAWDQQRGRREKKESETLVKERREDKSIAEAALGLLVNRKSSSIYYRAHVPSEWIQRAWLLAIDFPDFLFHFAHGLDLSLYREMWSFFSNVRTHFRSICDLSLLPLDVRREIKLIKSIFIRPFYFSESRKSGETLFTKKIVHVAAHSKFKFN
jgi:hypothetical protein